MGGNYPIQSHIWKKVIETVAAECNSIKGDEFRKLAENKYGPTSSDRVYISNDKNDIHDPFYPNDNILVETNLSSGYIVKFAYMLVEELRLTDGELKITLEEK